MRVWSLITALALAATGCAGLDLAELDDRDNLSRNLDEPPATTERADARSGTHTISSRVLAPESPTPSQAPTNRPAFEPPIPAVVPIPSGPVSDAPRAFVPYSPSESEAPPVAAPPIADVVPIPSAPATAPPQAFALSPAPAETPAPIPSELALESEPEPESPSAPGPANAPVEPDILPVSPTAPATRFASSVDTNVQEPSVPDALDLDRETIEELSRFVPPLADEPEGRARGPVVATVGNDSITLPEVTRAVRARIDRLPDGRKPNRREVIGMVQAEMETRVLGSMARQHGRAILGSSAELDRVLSAIDRQWSETELPRILEREGLRSPAEFDAFLADRGRSLADLHTVFVTRTLGKELMRREGRADDDLDAYFEELRDRIPIDSKLMRSASRRSTR